MDSSVLIANERCKAWATNLTRLGSGALAYVVITLYLRGTASLDLAFPLVGGLFLCWLGHMFLGLLQSER